MKSTLFLPLLLVLIALKTVAKPIVGSKVVVALNCGSKDEVVESHDKAFKYQADESYTSGKSIPVDYNSNDAAKQADILYTFEKRLYMYERHTYDEMIYLLPLRSGKHTLILKFAQMYFTAPGQRVFNIKIGSKVVRKDFDVIEKAGQKYAAHQEFIEIEVKSDGVYHDGVKVPNAISNNKLKLAFSKGKVDNPIVQGIIVYQDSLENSPQAEFNYLRSTWDKQKELQKAVKEEEKLKEIISIQKKKEKIVIRNDQIIVQKTQTVKQLEKALPTPKYQKFGFFRRLLMGPIGILFETAAFAVILFVLYKHVFLMDEKPKSASS